MRDIAITIGGMSCSHCLNAVNRALQSVDGVELRSVRIGQADIRAADDEAVARARAAIQQAGYHVEGVTDG